MTPAVFYFAALAIALIAELQAEGRSLVGWSAVFICLGLLFGWFHL